MIEFISRYKIVLGIFLIIAIVGGYFFFGKGSDKKESSLINIEPTIEVVPTLNPEDLGLIFSARSDNRAVKFKITNIDDIIGVDYEVSYLAKGDIPRGAIGRVDVKPTDTKIETNYIDLGTCSSGKCKYDEGVTSVKLVLKITKKGDAIFQTEKTLDLE